MASFDGAVALVTGGGTGLGRAVSTALARQGAAVGVSYSRSETEAMATVSEIRRALGRAEALRADISRSDEIERLVADVISRFGRLDVLVNNAGTTVLVPFSDLDGLTEVDWDRVMAVNVRAAWLLARAAARPMRDAGGGAIVNIASVSGLTPTGSSLAYAVSKAALIHLTKGLAVALAPAIRVNAVAPGLMLTRWGAALGEAEVDRYRQRALLGRTVTVEDVAEVVLEVATNRSVTGQTWVVDAGFAVR